MGQALYRKYRSRSFGEVIGQEAITSTLQKALKQGRISHAYLFSGPRGVGKTSVARILAHVVNELPYDGASSHLDIIEIDAASNRRIDEIRDLRAKVHIAPISATYKVYIIDEAHMLTREAFNALLKTLEEPPKHCIFILATTEAHKLPATIISRTQHFSFRPIAKNDLINRLSTIAKKEKLQVSDGALGLLAESAEGSLRDGLSLLDQLSTHAQVVDEGVVLEMLGLPHRPALEKLQRALQVADHSELLEVLQDLQQQGVNPAVIARRLAKQLRQTLIAGPSLSDRLVELLQALVEVPASFEPAEALELALLKAVAQIEKKSDSKAKLVEQPDKTRHLPEAAPVARVEDSAIRFNLADWPQILAAVKARDAAYYTALRLARPSLDGQTLSLAFAFPLHQKKINQAAVKQLIEQIIEEQTGQRLRIETVVDKQPASSRPSTDSPQPAVKDHSLAAISSIFGSAEVLESQELVED